MPGPRDRPHIIVRPEVTRTSEPYSPPSRGRGPATEPPEPAGGRQAHGRRLAQELRSAAVEGERQRAAVGFQVEGNVPGLFLTFQILPGMAPLLDGFEYRHPRDPRRQVGIAAVPPALDDVNDGQDPIPQTVTVFVPDSQRQYFLGRFARYAGTLDGGGASLRRVWDCVEGVRLATLAELWTDSRIAFPADPEGPVWWEVWLRRSDGLEVDRFRSFAAQAGVRVGERVVRFHDRIVFLAHGSPRQLSASLQVLGDMAEVRGVREPATFFIRQSRTDQVGWIRDLLARLTPPGHDAPAVCLLDTGVDHNHLLLSPALAGEDCQALVAAWGSHDHWGHGTEMAGVALYGDLGARFESDEPVHLAHRLESVKILPPAGENDPAHYGAITAEAAARSEIQAPERRRAFVLAVTAGDGDERGRPTSWSAALDAIAAGQVVDPGGEDGAVQDLSGGEGENPRLFVVSAGNVPAERQQLDHLDRCDVECVRNPAQAWNALTVGAYSERVLIQDPDLVDWNPVAPAGELSPWSSTSVAFQQPWPIKPEVLAEGGNGIVDGSGTVDGCRDLSLLTTGRGTQLLRDIAGTSPAAAEVARIGAVVSARYPGFWPETIRGLIVHTAEWTPAMRRRLDAEKKRARSKLIRRYGYGVASEERALRSARNAATLIVQDEIQPYEPGESSGARMREIHVHRLPWPREVLEDLGAVPVKVRVTLSYFIHPNPGEKGWVRRHRYASHGLRFHMIRPTEGVEDFRRRINQRALDQDEERPTGQGDAGDWYLEADLRDRGSLHSDILHSATAAEVAARNILAVYPVTGWWKEQWKAARARARVRYALLVSIETEGQDVDIWTPIVQQVGVEVQT